MDQGRRGSLTTAPALLLEALEALVGLVALGVVEVVVVAVVVGALVGLGSLGLGVVALVVVVASALRVLVVVVVQATRSLRSRGVLVVSLQAKSGSKCRGRSATTVARGGTLPRNALSHPALIGRQRGVLIKVARKSLVALVARVPNRKQALAELMAVVKVWGLSQ